MSDVKIHAANLELCGKVYPLQLTFNAIDELQEKYGSVEDALKKSAGIKDLIEIIRILVCEACDIHNDDHPDDVWEKPTARKIGRMVTCDNVDEVNDALFKCFGLSLPEAENDKGGEEEKNAVTA